MTDLLDFLDDFSVLLDNLVQFVGDFAADSRPLDRHLHGQISPPNRFQNLQQQSGVQCVFTAAAIHR
jgi:hypothetical protein